MVESVWFEAFGWLGSGLIILSLMQSRVLRFRVLNLAGAVISMIYNAAIGVWPFATMNLIISSIDIYWLNRLLRDRHSPAAYEVLEVGVDDAYLGHVLRTHLPEIRQRHPQISLEVPAMALGTGRGSGAPQGAAVSPARRAAFLVLKEAETVGVVLVRDEGKGVGAVELDFVTTRFRDFTPGEFVYQQSGVFEERGFRRLVVDDAVAEGEYYSRVGFDRVAGRWERRLEPTASAA